MSRGIFGGLGVLALVALAIVAYLGTFVVDPSHQALVLRFGDPRAKIRGGTGGSRSRCGALLFREDRGGIGRVDSAGFAGARALLRHCGRRIARGRLFRSLFHLGDSLLGYRGWSSEWALGFGRHWGASVLPIVDSAASGPGHRRDNPGAATLCIHPSAIVPPRVAQWLTGQHC